MKRISSTIAVSLAFAFSIGMGMADTVPVGIIKITIPAAVDANTPSRAAISVPLYRAASFQGAVASVDSSTAFTVSGANFVANQFSTSPFLVRVMSGAGAGRFFLITGNTASQLTVNSDTDLTTLLAAGDTVQVVPANTLGSIFGSTAPGFMTGNSSLASDTIMLWNGATWDLYYNNGAHWQKAASLNPNLDSTIIYPDEGLYISRRSTTGPLTIVLNGTVPSTTEQSVLAGGGSTFLANRFPVNTTLIATGLQNSPNWSAGLTADTADNVYLWDTQLKTWDVYFFNGTHWRQSGNLNPNVDNTLISAGTAIFLTRSNGSPADLIQALPYTP